MITCAQARELMLEADPSDLEDGASELGLHLAGCDACRGEAARILSAERALAGMLMSAAPGRPASDAIRIAGSPPAARFRAIRRAIPLAAAAVLAGLLFSRRAGQPLPTLLPAATRDAGAVTVAAPAGRSLALLNTDNPDVTLVWFFPQEQP